MRELKLMAAVVCAMIGTGLGWLPHFIAMMTVDHGYHMPYAGSWTIMISLVLCAFGWTYIGVFSEREDNKHRRSNEPNPKLPLNVINFKDAKQNRSKSWFKF